MMNRIVKVVLVVLVVAVALLVWQARKVLPMGVGYVAKTICSEHFVAGRDDLQHIWADIQLISPVFKLASFNVKQSPSRVESTALFGAFRSIAVYRPALGCTIAAGVTADSLRPLVVEQTDEVAGSSSIPIVPVFDPELESALDQAFTEPTADSHRETRAIVIVHNGAIVAERYAEPFGPDTPLIGWSMTKSIVNNLVGLLVADGRLEVNTPAPVAAWRSADDPRSAITLEHLLQMSSGLDFVEVYEPGSDATNMLFTVTGAADYASAAPLAQPPGSKWYYSSGTSNILSRIVRDKVGGTEAAMYQFMQSRLFGPLGMTSMTMENDASGTPVGSSFSYATARDWATLGQFWLQNGAWQGRQLLPAGWMAYSTKPAPAAPRGEYGAQFWLNTDLNGQGRAYPDLPESTYFAHGFNQQIVAVFPEKNVVIVRLGFTTDDSWDTNGFMSQVLAALE